MPKNGRFPGEIFQTLRQKIAQRVDGRGEFDVQVRVLGQGESYA